MANYRTRLRSIGCPELSINAVKEKRGAMSHGPNQVKKPRKAEVNYCPDYLAGETKDSLEEERKALILEVKKNNQQLIKSKMERTFACRRPEVVKDMPFIAEFKNRWPALFSESQCCLNIIIMGIITHTIWTIIAEMDKNPSVEERRTFILKSTG
ncbi:unnamed protein product [Leuciscus chuanchicus]